MSDQALEQTLERSARIDQLERDALINALGMILAAMETFPEEMPESMDQPYRVGKRIMNLIEEERPHV